VNRKPAPDIESLQNLQKSVLALFFGECIKMKKRPHQNGEALKFLMLQRSESEKSA